jgi:hypothetical protein
MEGPGVEVVTLDVDHPNPIHSRLLAASCQLSTVCCLLQAAS